MLGSALIEEKDWVREHANAHNEEDHKWNGILDDLLEHSDEGRGTLEDSQPEEELHVEEDEGNRGGLLDSVVRVVIAVVLQVQGARDRDELHLIDEVPEISQVRSHSKGVHLSELEDLVEPWVIEQ